jgi:DNA-binding NarL/FixJ family response regulator
MRPTRILLADDHEFVRKGLRTVIQDREDWEVCGEASNGRDAVALADELEPDIVVLDISMPELNGLDAARQILADHPGTEVLILTMHDSEELIKQVLAVGARGYMLKSDASRQLVAAIEALRHHKPFLTSEVNEVVLRGYLDGVEPLKGEGTGELTPREREIVQLLAEGNSSKEVAAKLNIAVKTVETHRANVMRKLDLHSVTELVRYAIRNNIIEP